MRRSGVPFALVLTACAGLAACATPTPSSDLATEALEQGLLDEALPAAPAQYTPDGDEVLLEERIDGAQLWGRMLGARLDTDEEPVWVIRTALNGRPVDPALEGARVRDATFIARGLVTIGEDHVLRAHVDGRVRELDAEALGPLSVGGDVVVYVRGSMPFYELARADLAAGTAGPITSDMAPVWSPAVSPDGRSIVFVSGVSGEPRLYRLGANDRPELLPRSAAFPSGLGAPRFDGTTLVFLDEAGATHSLAVAALPAVSVDRPSAGALTP